MFSVFRYLVQVSDGLRDENGGILCSPPPLCFRHTGESPRARPANQQMINISQLDFIITHIFTKCLLLTGPSLPANLEISQLLLMQYFISLQSAVS